MPFFRDKPGKLLIGIKMIRPSYIADVIYMTDVKPENRIAVQYLPKRTA